MCQKIGGKHGETSTAANTTTTTEYGLPVVVDRDLLSLFQPCPYTKDGKATKQKLHDGY